MSKDALLDAVNEIRGAFGETAIMWLGKFKKANIETFSTGSIALDRALGGGIPVGRIVEIYGAESSGKTTLASHIMAEAQKLKKQVAFVDAEHAYDPAYSAKIGVDNNKLLFSQPDTGEQALEIVESLVRSGKVSVIVIDSVAVLTPRSEIEGEMGDKQPGQHAKLMSQALRKLAAVVSKTGTTLIFINQIRYKIGMPSYMNPETTTGGNALKFYASQRLSISKGKKIEKDGQVIASETKVKVVKNKIAPPFRTAQFNIRFNVGIDKIGELIDLGVEAKEIEKSGAFFEFEKEKYHGEEALRKYLEENTEKAEKLRLKIMETVGKTDPLTGDVLD